eukprot:3482717-Amphidinium_carterae.1
MTNPAKWSCEHGTDDNWSRRQVCRLCSAARPGAAGEKPKAKGAESSLARAEAKGKGKNKVADNTKVEGLLAKLVQQQGAISD